MVEKFECYCLSPAPLYLGVLSDDLVSRPLSEHQAILASGYLGIDLFGHHSIWTSVCLGISQPDLDSDQDAHPSSMHEYLVIGKLDYWEFQVSCHPHKNISGCRSNRSCYLDIKLSRHRAIWLSNYLDIGLSWHQAIWASVCLAIGTGQWSVGSWDQILPQELFRHCLADRSGHWPIWLSFYLSIHCAGKRWDSSMSRQLDVQIARCPESPMSR